jgi:hypothetical protein
LLEYDKTIGSVFVFLGLAAFLIALIIPLLIKKENEKTVDLNLDL